MSGPYAFTLPKNGQLTIRWSEKSTFNPRYSGSREWGVRSKFFPYSLTRTSRNQKGFNAKDATGARGANDFQRYLYVCVFSVICAPCVKISCSMYKNLIAKVLLLTPCLQTQGGNLSHNTNSAISLTVLISRVIIFRVVIGLVRHKVRRSSMRSLGPQRAISSTSSSGTAAMASFF